MVTAAAAVDTNNTLDSILPPTVEASVKLVNAHLSAGASYCHPCVSLHPRDKQVYYVFTIF